jgi:hypothetical protein
MSASEIADEPEGRSRYGTIIIVGGGCYGGYYLRQLRRAVAAGALTADRLLVVDRDPQCAVAAELTAEAPNAELVVAEWSAFFTGYLNAAADAPARAAADAIVPSPLMPHLMGDWLVARARDRWGSRVATRPFDRVPDVPWERPGGDGTHYVSFATWMCPINCVEPRLCPHTRDTRSWSMPVALTTHAERVRAEGESLDVAVLHCRHRAYGVGMFDTAEVLAADDRILAAGAAGTADVIIGTVSHCHGALTRLTIGAATRDDSHIV